MDSPKLNYAFRYKTKNLVHFKLLVLYLKFSLELYFFGMSTLGLATLGLATLEMKAVDTESLDMEALDMEALDMEALDMELVGGVILVQTKLLVQNFN